MAAESVDLNRRLPELREVLKENDQKVYDFVYFMLGPSSDLEEQVVSIFRSFGDLYRRGARQKRFQWEYPELRLQLFMTAWESIRRAIHVQKYAWLAGRDTRVQKSAEEDLIRIFSQGKLSEDAFESFLQRLNRVDFDFRAPLVLRDILGFEDEEVVRILGTRWGVYRHRLHRGRVSLCEGLRAKHYVFQNRPATV